MTENRKQLPRHYKLKCVQNNVLTQFLSLATRKKFFAENILRKKIFFWENSLEYRPSNTELEAYRRNQNVGVFRLFQNIATSHDRPRFCAGGPNAAKIGFGDKMADLALTFIIFSKKKTFTG